ncbi:hypothetical protein ES708_02317 [subsurface metagenome]
MKIYTEPSKTLKVKGEYDVIVAGAGVAGCVAAIQSGRMGIKTLLIERTGNLGGVAVSGMSATVTNFYFTKSDKKVIGGISYEVQERLGEKGIIPPGWKNHIVPQIPNNADEMQVLLFDMLKEADVKIMLETLVSDTICGETEDGLTPVIGLIIENKEGRLAVFAKTIVDSTGDADIAYYAGAPCLEMARHSCTLMFEMGNVDLEKTMEYYKEHPNDFDEERDIAIPFEEFVKNWYERGLFHIPHGGGSDLSVLQQAIKEGKYSKEKGLGVGLDALGMFGTKGSNRVLVNSNFYNIDSIKDNEKLSIATLEARERAVELAKLLNEILPGFEKAFITRTASNIAVRCSRYIDGEYMLTEKDAFDVKEFDDTACYTTATEKTKRGGRVTDKALGLPYRVFLPRKIDNVIIGTGKCVSTEKPFLRGQANTMLIGQTAGTAAALAAKTGKSVKKLGYKDVRDELEKYL